MRPILKGALLLFVFIIALSVMPVSNAQALDTELFVYKSPDFTVNVPKDWYKSSTNPHPAIVLEKKSGDINTFIIAVADLPADITLKSSPQRFITLVQNMWNATNCEILYEKEIKLNDDTQAIEYEIKWNHPAASLYTYRVVAFKNKKSIAVEVTSDKQVSDEIKQLPLSLTFQ